MRLPIPQEADDGDDFIDMTRTMAPDVPNFHNHIQHALAAVAEMPNLAYCVQRHRFFGSISEREVVAQWLKLRLGFQPNVEQLLLTGGTQNCLQILFGRLVRPGDCIATEMLSYAATSQICGLFSIPVIGIEIDEYGLIPEAFRKHCQEQRIKILYCNPTIHNPTTSILPKERRHAIADIAREYGVVVIEDDVHGKLVPDAPPTMASIAPDITWYIMSVSKCIGMGLRVAFLLAPDEAQATALREPIQSISSWFTPGISCAIVTNLIQTGAADEITRQMQMEIKTRQKIAQAGLSDFRIQTKDQALHLWLELPSDWTVNKLVAAVRPFRITLRPSDLFNAGRIVMPNAIRLSLVAPRTQEDLSFAIDKIAETLSG